MSAAEQMTNAYLRAIDFTECGEDNQPDHGSAITPIDKAQAFLDCRNFLWAIGSVAGYPSIEGFDDLNPEQLGHDLWLTRNGHGAGFWDRPEVYGKANAILFTRIAQAMGGHDVDFVNQEETNDS